MLTASMSVLFVEVVVGAIALLVWVQTQESPGPSYSALGILLLLLMVPFVAVAGVVLGALLTVSVVIPLLVVVGWLGRRLSVRGAWWWVPALLAAVTALPSLAAAVLGEAGSLAVLGGWLAVTAGLTAPTSVARRLLLPDRPQLSGRAMFGRVAWFGTLSVLTVGVLAGIGLYAGIGYEPPQLSWELVAGTWSDGKGGTLVLTVDGKATATRVETFRFDSAVPECTGVGTWEYDPGVVPWSQEVDVSVKDCSMDTWQVLGTPEHPKLFVYKGDHDSWDLYILQPRG
ncbi:hypothetical protein AB0N93_36715 [Streptomyces sp. NPDC091267]|uniref:hypothetical protein n=1 Tax=Streptomyces sp. NPDC091267 TaxID=3155195 RepID=UPI0034174446